MKQRLKRTWLFPLILCLNLAPAQSPADFAGRWQGEIQVPGSALGIVVELQTEGAALGGTITIPTQDVVDAPLENITTNGDGISFAIQGVPGAPTFEGTLAEGRIEGTFSQEGQEVPFALAQGETVTEGEAVTGGEAVMGGDAEGEATGGAVTGTAAPAAAGTYEDPRGRFSVPIPTNWTVEEENGYALLSEPDGDISIYLLVVPGTDPRAAVAEAWAQVEPDFALEPTFVEPPSEPGVEATVVANYDGSGERVYQGYGRLVEGNVYVFLIDGDLAALERRSAQTNIIATGFTITGLAGEDLTGTAPLPVTDEMTSQLATFVEDALEQFGVPGAAVAIVQNGEVVYARGFGVKEAGGTDPVTPDMQMMIGSTGKTMTTMLMAALVDDDLMSWGTPVVDVLPEFAVANPELSKIITMRNLVCACTGVPQRDFELFFNADDLSAEGVVESLRAFEFFTDFGEAFQYSNQMVGAGGYAAAAADGAAFGELFGGYAGSLQRRVLEPTGMMNTTLFFDGVTARGDHGAPHQSGFDGTYAPIPLSDEQILVPIAPAGSHWSTASDMARYLETELGGGVAPDGERVVSEENLRTTWTAQVPVSATTSYGLGWFVDEYKGLPLLHHGGNTLGFTSDLAFLPDADLCIVVLTNAQGTNAVNEAIRTRLFELVFGGEPEAEGRLNFVFGQTEEGLSELEATLQDVDPAAAQPFVGTYTNVALGEMTLTLTDATLTFDAGEFVSELRPVVDDSGEPDGYILYGPPLAGVPVRLEASDNADPTVVFGEGAASYTFERVE